jgi:hypothetical protein
MSSCILFFQRFFFADSIFNSTKDRAFRMSMNDLPPEVVLRIFSMLDYRHLASVAQGHFSFLIGFFCNFYLRHALSTK